MQILDNWKAEEYFGIGNSVTMTRVSDLSDGTDDDYYYYDYYDYFDFYPLGSDDEPPVRNAQLVISTYSNPQNQSIADWTNEQYAVIKNSYNSKYVNDDLQKITDAICEKKYDCIEIITDNYGLELISDIIFALLLLDFQFAKKVVFHARVLPAFVSDVIVSEYGDDFKAILDYLNTCKSDCKVVSKFQEYKNKNDIEIKPNLYWNMPDCYSEKNSCFKEIIPDNNKTLVVVKGDLNFRRLLDDRDWLKKRSFKKRVEKLNASVLALRAIKSSLLVDVSKDWACTIKDSITGIDGKYCSIHFYANKSWYDKLKRNKEKE